MLVASGQLAFVNGGWVQHDEATTHYRDMIDQTTRGHDFLLRTFNVTPTVAWQIDPFGHSSTQVIWHPDACIMAKAMCTACVW